MHLTSLHAENVLSFGSFKVSFEPGLNVIVGPNGAGKSNVVRAVGLVATALDIAVGAAQASIDVPHQLRIGAPERRGTVRLGVELTEDDERALILTFVRALVASSWDRTAVTSPSVDSAVEQQIAARVRDEITEEMVGSLLTGRLVMLLDGHAPVSVSLAYEFDHDGEAYHYGLAGPSAAMRWVSRGAFLPTRRSGWGGQPLDLSEFLTSDPPAPFAFADLLPAADRMVSWEVKKHPSGGHLLLSEDLTRALDIEGDSDTLLSLNLILHRAVRERIVLTENLRRPPRTTYALAEVGPPVVLEDAGDLPLELYRRRVSQEPGDRHAFSQVQDLFQELTGHRLDITATIAAVPAEPSARFGLSPYAGRNLAPGGEQVGQVPEYVMHIQPVVSVPGGDIPVENAGAGVWEGLVACTYAVPIPGRVLLLDEPATNMHPTWQRRFLSYLARLAQAIVVTHSPYLVPGDRVEDLDRITRLRVGPDGTIGADVRGDSVPPEWKVRWRQSLLRWTEARASLFAQGVILLEGDTELGVFGEWFSREPVVQDPNTTHDALNLQLFDVASDKSFGAHVSFLNAFGIPWSIVCDGPVLSPKREVSLLEQLRGAGLTLDPPDNDAPFDDWKAFWERHGVFTVADQFGGLTDKDKNKNGEIEAFFDRIDAALWQETKDNYPKSKTRAGYAFAEMVDLNNYPDHLAELRRLWAAIREHVGDLAIRIPD
jgi:AAA domain/AAA domain, putative AbiEii toxin, Type IV TA system